MSKIRKTRLNFGLKLTKIKTKTETKPETELTKINYNFGYFWMYTCVQLNAIWYLGIVWKCYGMQIANWANIL